jgi:hypothetical protein
MMNKIMQFFRWFLATFGVSDTVEKPDASILAARAAGHWSVGSGSTLFAWSIGVVIWAALILLAVLYGAWEAWQWWVDPAKYLRRVARRWDAVVDWAAVMMGGISVGLALTYGGWPVALAVALSVVLILGSASIMARRKSK